MTLFARQSSVIKEKIDQLDRELVAAKAEVAKHALSSAIDDDARSDMAQAEVHRVEHRLTILRSAFDAALTDERRLDAEKARKAAEAVCRAGEQHAGAYRREAAAIEQAAADLVQHYRAAQAALGRLRAVVGDDPETSPGLSLADLRRQVLDELWRASVEPSIAGDRSPFVASPSIQIASNEMPPLGSVIDRATRHATGAFRQRMGLDRAHVHAEGAEVAP